MTNREWLESLSNKEMGRWISILCPLRNVEKPCRTMCNHDSEHCEADIAEWLMKEHKEPKKELTQAQLCEAFELKFGKRRAISLDEVKEVTKEIFK